VYFSLPIPGVTYLMTTVLLVGVAFAIIAMVMMWRELAGPAARIGRYFAPIVLVLSVTVSCMAGGRHFYREDSLAAHRSQIRQASEDMRYAAQDAAWREKQGIALVKLSPGERVFRACATCHQLDQQRNAPSIREIQDLYRDNPDGIVAWAKQPGRKRTQFTPMPSFSHLPDTDLYAVAKHMLEIDPTQRTATEDVESGQDVR